MITSDLHIALFLSEFKQIEVTIIGGRIDDSSQSCIGDHGRRLLQTIWPDLAFVSCNGWDLEKDHRPDGEKAALKRDLMANARRRILLADSPNTAPVTVQHRSAGVVDRYRDRRPPAG